MTQTHELSPASIKRRITYAKRYPHLDEMHPDDRVEYLAGKYSAEDNIRFLCPVCKEYYEQTTKNRGRGHMHWPCAVRKRAKAQRWGENYHSFNDLTPEFQEKCRNKELTQRSRADFVCPICGDIYNTILGSHEKGGYCGSCAAKLRRPSCQARTDYDFIDEVHPDDRHLIEQGKVNNKSKVRIKCSDCGEYFSQVIASRTNGFTRCENCGDVVAGIANRRKEYKFINPLREDFIEALANGEIRTTDKVVFICPEHGEYWQKIKSGQKHGCQACGLATTPYDFYNFLREHTNEIVVNDREQISPQEIDFYLPEHKLGFEFNDVNTHQTLFAEQQTDERNRGGKPANYHYNKWKKAKEKGIVLMHVWDVDWQDSARQEKIKNIIIALLNNEAIEEISQNTMMFYDNKARTLIKYNPDNYIEMREKCINGEMSKYFTCGIRV